MTDPSLAPALKELERAFHAFVPLFPRDMPRPLITIQTNGRRSHTLGWFWDQNWRAGEVGLPEINISAEYLSRGPTDVAETLLHEMVHFCNALNGIRDCSGHGYHNRRFRELCHKIGLNCENQGYRGWSSTSLTSALETRVAAVALDPEVFQVSRRSRDAQPPGGPSKLKLWQCACGVRARVAIRDFQAKCLKCGADFRRMS